jgi:hypothetical protein
MPTELSGPIDLSQFLIQDKEPAADINKDSKEDKQLPFNKPLILYNKVLRGLEDKVVFHLKGEGKGEDKDLLLNNLQVLTGTILTDFSK